MGAGWGSQASLRLQLICLSPQHLALLVKYLIHAAIPDIPGWVAEEMAKLEYQRREAFKVQGWGLADAVSGGNKFEAESLMKTHRLQSGWPSPPLSGFAPKNSTNSMESTQ